MIFSRRQLCERGRELHSRKVGGYHVGIERRLGHGFAALIGDGRLKLENVVVAPDPAAEEGIDIGFAADIHAVGRKLRLFNGFFGICGHRERYISVVEELREGINAVAPCGHSAGGAVCYEGALFDEADVALSGVYRSVVVIDYRRLCDDHSDMLAEGGVAEAEIRPDNIALLKQSVAFVHLVVSGRRHYRFGVGSLLCRVVFIPCVLAEGSKTFVEVDLKRFVLEIVSRAYVIKCA